MEKILFEKKCTEDGHLGLITLNKPSALNALDAEMYRLLLEQLKVWEHDNEIKTLVIQSSLEKSFCAGGDVKGLVQKLINEKQVSDETVEFFTSEYTTDLYLFNYPKPVIILGKGIVMGGGLGLFHSGSYRIGFESSHFAMPEISIGLFPDVGASYFLNQLRVNGVGEFLAITGARISGGLAQHFGLSDFLLPTIKNERLISDICSLKLKDVDGRRSKELDEYFMRQSTRKLLSDEDKQWLHELSEIEGELRNIFDSENYESLKIFFDKAEFAHKGLIQAKDLFLRGSELSAKLIMRQLKIGKQLSLKEAFYLEWHLALKCCEKGDFVEGVRALLIDKDQKPKWLLDHCSIESFFDFSEPEALVENCRLYF